MQNTIFGRKLSFRQKGTKLLFFFLFSPLLSRVKCKINVCWRTPKNNIALFVFMIGSCEQNGVSLLRPVSESVFIALSDGTFLLSLHGSFKNHQHKDLWLAVGTVSTNQVLVEWATIECKMNGTIKVSY